MRKVAALAALLLASCRPNSPANIEIADSWARATVPNQSSSAAYFTISNMGGEADNLQSVSSPAADASIHSTTMDQGVMRMRPVNSLRIASHSKVVLEPGGLHVMLMGLKHPLAEGSTIEVDLKFRKSGERKVTVAVRPATATGASR